MSAPSAVRDGVWCTTCSGRFKHSIEFYQKVAEERGGKVLSKRYVTAKQPIKWQCAKGHIFSSRPSDVYHANVWCLKCSINERRTSGALYKHTLSEMQKIAEKNGGKCLSESYLGGFIHMKWVCSNKHVFETTPFTVLKGSWCKICRHKEGDIKKRTPYKKLAELVKSKGGRLITTSNEYIEQYDQLKIICQSGHQWTAKLGNLIKGSWCHTCRNITIANKNRLPFNVYLKMAKAKKGKLLTMESEYKNSVEKMHWQCKEGHQWMAAGSRVQQGFWCKQCRWDEIEQNRKAKLKVRK
ncbi:MAG: hypothetical protein IPP71_07985 [Bacteroidetes bacterium]|nr:hypothetical protein [Bacteroidota bacterium]